MVLFLFLISFSLSLILEYRLWKNYGQVLYDYSGNGNHGWNGWGTDTDIKDCLFTDRGAYLNTDCWVDFAKILYPNPVSLVFWALSDSTQSTGNLVLGRIFSRWDPSRSFLIFHDKLNLRARVYYQGVNNWHELFSSNNIWQTRNNYIDKWALISGEINQNTIKLKINGNDIILFTDTSNYQEYSPAIVHRIGNDNQGHTGFGGFVWYVAIYNKANVESSYLSITSTNCFIGTCSTCNPSFIIPSLGTGCGPDSVSTIDDSNGNRCDVGYGCKGSMTIKCNCPSKSCEFTSTDVCSCIESTGLLYQAACSCGIGGQGCCQSECSSCSIENYCLTCKASLSIIVNGQCTCQDGYGSDPSTSSLSCLKCITECKTCSTYNTCTNCIDSLSSLTNGKCICLEGHFALITSTSFTCEPCLYECQTCDNSSSCLTCKDLNSLLTSGRCLCKNGYFSIYLNQVLQNCLKCNETCSKCTQLITCTECISLNSSPINGTCTCHDEYFPSSTLTQPDSCQPCSFPCKTCNSSFYCLSCLISNYLAIDGKCICPDKFYEESNLCKSCLDPCETCSSLTYCSSCIKENYQAINGKCYCLPGFYENEGLCRQCESPCKTCLNSNYCLECRPLYSESKNGTCLCKDQYYKKNLMNSKEFVCELCNTPCFTCLSLSKCMTCDDVLKNVDELGRCKCKDGFYFDIQKCLPCNETCATCKSLDECTSCFNSSFELVSSGKCLKKCPGNLIRINEICDCNPGKILKNESCVNHYFYSSLKINKSNKIYLKFDDSLNTSLNSDEISIILQNRNFKDFKLFTKSSTQIILILNLHESVQKNTSISINLKKPLFSKNNAILKNYEFHDFLFEFEYIDPSTKLLIKNFETTSKSMVTVSIGISIISNPAAAWAMIGTLQLLPYIPLSKNYNESVTRTFFTSAGGFNLLPNFLVYVFSEDSSSRPSREVRSVGIKSSVFWLNLGKVILPLIVLLILWPLISFLTRFKFGKLTVKLLKVLQNYKYNVFSRFWIQAYLDVGVFSILNLKALGVALTPVVLVIFLFSIYEKISHGEESILMKYGTFFYEFKNNKGLFSVYFYVLYFLRRLQFILTQFYLNEYEIMQMTFNMISCFLMVAYLVFYCPFKDKYVQISNFTTEVTFLVIFTAYMIFSNDRSLISEKLYQNIVIFVVIACIGIQTVISLIQFLIALKEFYLELQELRNKLISEECKSEVMNIEKKIRIM